jgi:hypothetical protein
VTGLDALNAIEKAMAELEISDEWGYPRLPFEAVWDLCRFHGERWRKAYDDFEFGAAIVEEFQERVLAMIQEYGRFLFRERLEAKLREIAGGAA